MFESNQPAISYGLANSGPEKMNDQKFHILARAVIHRDGHILLAHAKGAANTFLPGGHVETGESMHQCLKREIAEEFGGEAEIGDYLGAVEHAWIENGVENFEINHAFSVSLCHPVGVAAPESREPHLEFFWSSLADLEKHSLKPAPFIDLLQDDVIRSGAWWASTLVKG